ncbi:MAG: hypothetical protein KatS3mg028_1079 [Bacteroidia bacterium]|nr:MAG: hypothetical protein KatS3mg028_1079 [Bacteroidia bacterium]
MKEHLNIEKCLSSIKPNYCELKKQFFYENDSSNDDHISKNYSNILSNILNEIFKMNNLNILDRNSLDERTLHQLWIMSLKWKLKEIYEACRLAEFYARFYQEYKCDLFRARQYYDCFMFQAGYPSEPERSFDCAPNLFAFAYLILVKITEFLEHYFLLPDEKSANNKNNFECIYQIIFNNVDSFIEKYKIEVICLQPQDKQIEKILKRIRNSFAHFRYEIREFEIFIFDVNPKNSKDKMILKIRTYQLLNIVKDLGTNFYNIISYVIMKNNFQQNQT